jgi:hypothetical protein
MPFGTLADPRGPFMSIETHSVPRWATASYGVPADTSPMELSALGQHLDLCRGKHGRLSSLRCAAERVHGFAAARFISTLLVAALLVAVGMRVL